jgi:two-component system, cell cycle sensor histidine kinase and response regulator CckA
MERDDSPLEFSALSTLRLAHDLQNLLSVMGSCFDSLTIRCLGINGAERDLSGLDDAIEGAFRVSQELLAAAGLRQTLEPTVFDLHDLLARYHGVLQRMFGDRIRLVVQHDNVDMILLAAPAQVEWMLLNLAANARDAMPDGGVVCIETAAIDRVVGPTDDPIRRQRFVRVTIRDEGHGISDDVRKRMFEPSFTTRVRGTGLGLTSVAMTVRELGGWLYVEGREEEGTSVHVLLPLYGERSQAT